MPFKSLPQETSTLLFQLPHISNLFVFKDNLNNKAGMTEIVTEILRFGQMEIIYMGAAVGNNFDYEGYLQHCVDCAIIRVNVMDTIMLNGDLEKTRLLFIQQLENFNNIISMESNFYDEMINVSTVDLIITPPNYQADSHDESRIQAA